MAINGESEDISISQRVYRGDVYSTYHKDPALINTGTIDIGFTLGNRINSFLSLSIVTNSSLMEILFCENAVISDGTPITPLNRNRNEKLELFSEFFALNPTITDPGIPIYDEYHIGTSEIGVNKTASSKSINIPWLLEEGNSYLLKLTNISGDTNAISMGLHFIK